MMPEPSEIDVSDPRVMDRLIDGELTDAEERAVIARLNQTPDGWRRCALAMLEARCWQRAARHVQGLFDSGQSSAPTSASRASQSSRCVPWRAGSSEQPRSMRWPGILALCAALLLALGVGNLLPRPWSRGASPDRSTAQRVERPAKPIELVDTGATQSQQRGAMVVPDRIVQDAVIQDRSASSQDLLLGNLTLVDNSGHQFDVPVYDWNQQVADQLMYRSQPLSPELFRQLKRHGVRSHQTYVPIKLKDGRQVIVPVQKLEIVPVGGTAY